MLTLLLHNYNSFVLKLTAGTLHVLVKHVVAKSTQNITVEWLGLLLDVREVCGSGLGSEFLLFLQVNWVNS
jgi:hypothetical protein